MGGCGLALVPRCHMTQPAKTNAVEVEPLRAVAEGSRIAASHFFFFGYSCLNQTCCM